jgi:transcriptional regulator with XRE-family HTH domain
MPKPKDQKYKQEFAKRLRDRMEYLEIGQRRLSDHSGIHQVTISLYMHGKRVPRADTAAKLAIALAMPVEDLIGFTVD